MKILIVGSGGREHALAWRLKQSPRVTQIIAAPGNPGIAELAECVPVAADNIEGLVDLARIERPNLVIVGQAFAGPMLDHLEEDPGRFDLSSLMMISSSGVMWSRENKDGEPRRQVKPVFIDKKPPLRPVDPRGPACCQSGICNC